MSSRQVKWLREQLSKGKKQTPEPIDEDEGAIEVEQKEFDFSLLAEDEENSAPAINIPAVSTPPPPPSSTSSKKSSKKKKQIDEDEEFEALALELAKKKTEKQQKEEKAEDSEPHFNMASLNLARELKRILGTTTFDAYLKVPKSASPNRFMSKLKSYPTPFPQFFSFQNLGDNYYAVNFTPEGESQYSIFTALQRINDVQGITDLLPQMPLCPLVLPIICQQRLFDRDFDRATEMAMRGLYVIQQSLPQDFVPLKTKLLPSPARNQFLELIAFIARFAYRRCCFETSTSLWKFGLSLTEDDPLNFILLAAVPAMYAKDEKFIDSVLNSDLKWRGIPVRLIPDWGLAKATFALPDDILPLTNEIAKWSFGFTDIGAESEFDVPPLLMSLVEAFRRRTKKFFDGKDDVLETAAMLSTEAEMPEELLEAITYWSEVDTTDVDVADFVEEMVLPAG